MKTFSCDLTTSDILVIGISRKCSAYPHRIAITISEGSGDSKILLYTPDKAREIAQALLDHAEMLDDLQSSNI